MVYRTGEFYCSDCGEMDGIEKVRLNGFWRTLFGCPSYGKEFGLRCRFCGGTAWGNSYREIENRFKTNLFFPRRKIFKSDDPGCSLPHELKPLLECGCTVEQVERAIEVLSRCARNAQA